MFWELVNAITDGFMDLAEDVFSIFTSVGAVAPIVTLAVIGMFISFVVMNKTGVLSKAGSSDRVKKRSEK